MYEKTPRYAKKIDKKELDENKMNHNLEDHQHLQESHRKRNSPDLCFRINRETRIWIRKVTKKSTGTRKTITRIEGKETEGHRHPPDHSPSTKTTIHLEIILMIYHVLPKSSLTTISQINSYDIFLTLPIIGKS